MAKYVYPAIFEPDEELGGYCVYFPDVQGAYTQGDNLAEAMEMAQDVLCLMLYNHEIHGNEILPPTPINKLIAEDDNIVTLISCDTNYYKRYFANKLVNKTVTIPAQLNFEAEQAGVNFSQVLRTGLEKILHQK
ncbi:MAG: type II toxin-antitoxin system HicB family antitoxin [Oscillospiraceae bacterium]|nr:type II toxin-antitoxin system HicB family antitoxin [Oscillospiraceae bacterium]